VSQSIEERLERRLGRLHARLRLGIEADHEAQVFGHGINYFVLGNNDPIRMVPGLEDMGADASDGTGGRFEGHNESEGRLGAALFLFSSSR
jgi:hypothetical protein